MTCAPTATRTRDLPLRRRSLYPLSYRGLRHAKLTRMPGVGGAAWPAAEVDGEPRPRLPAPRRPPPGRGATADLSRHFSSA